jgi:hypothetical protein
VTRTTTDIDVPGMDGPIVSRLDTYTIAAPGALANLLVRSVTPLPHFTCDHVDDLLEPLAWSSLSDGRLSLHPLVSGGDGPLVPGGPPRSYRETFLLAPGRVLRPVLTFVRRTLDDGMGLQGSHRGRALEYRLATAEEAGDSQSRMVLVDEGSVVVHELPEGLVIRTTKRLRFTPPFDGLAFVATANLAGYDEANAAMIQAALTRAMTTVSPSPEPESEALVLDLTGLTPAVAAPGAATEPAPGEPATSKLASAEPPDELGGEQFATYLVNRFVDQSASATASWLTATAAAWTASFEMAMNGEYSGERLVSDVRGAWSRYQGLLSSLVGVAAPAAAPKYAAGAGTKAGT